ncbi:MAG: ATP:cob(I)alamin adenosyltransferase [Planctomycetaceae bacterium]|nr:ATP:cob(I)alamin adenosyltransferase [Planctomycetaceae bacterium]
MKIYTRKGDAGLTALFGAPRVHKHDLRVEAYGYVDETNAALGLAAAASTFDEISTLLAQLQHRLFDLGADLCTPLDSQHADKITRISAAHVAELEKHIDAATQPLPELKTFVLPGGTELAARLPLARTVARRAERCLVALAQTQPIGDHVIPFVNRLSDLLFTLARRANQLAGRDDIPWQPNQP